MTPLGRAIFARLTAAQPGDTGDDTDALAVITPMVGRRVYPLVSQDGVYPLITYQTHKEAEGSITALATKEFTVTLTIETKKDAAHPAAYSDLTTLAVAVQKLLDRRGGTWGGIPVKGFYFKGADEDSFSNEQNAEEIFYQAEHEYRVWAQA
jgi:hypothetical protein